MRPVPPPSPADGFAEDIARRVADALRDEVRDVVAVDGGDMLSGLDEIADHLGVSVNHASYHAGRTFPARRVGRMWVTSRSALSRWVSDSLTDADEGRVAS